MPFQIPNAVDAAFADQAEPDSRDIDVLVAAHSSTGVVTGCAVTAQGSPNMTVAVAAGSVMVNGVTRPVTAGNVTIATADGVNPRFDLITATSTGTKGVVQGTASSNAVLPAIPASRAVLAAVYVPAGDTSIQTNQIIDKRVLLPAGLGTLNILDFGADPTAIADSAAAINACIEAATDNPNADPTTTTRQAIARVYIPPGTYTILSPINVQSIQGLHFFGAGRSSRISPNADMSRALYINGVSHSIFENFSIRAPSLTPILTDVIDMEWAGTPASTYRNRLADIEIASIKCIWGINLGGSSSNLQVSEITLDSVNLAGNWITSETTYWQRGISIGSGTPANIENAWVYNSGVTFFSAGLYNNAVNNVSNLHSSFGGNGADFFQVGGGPLLVDNHRSENSKALLDGNNSTVKGNYTLRNVYMAVGAIDASLEVIKRWAYSGTLLLENLMIQPGQGSSLYLVRHTGPGPNANQRIIVIGGHGPITPANLLSTNVPQFTHLINLGWNELDPTTGASVSTADITVRGTSAKVIATGGIGIGNSAAATTPGTVTKKMQVFDESGTSLGYVPIYDAIT